jgi:hypothetical protein
LSFGWFRPEAVDGVISSHIEATCDERNACWIIFWTMIAGSSDDPRGITIQDASDNTQYRRIPLTVLPYTASRSGRVELYSELSKDRLPA